LKDETRLYGIPNSNGVEWSCDAIQEQQSVNLHEDKIKEEEGRRPKLTTMPMWKIAQV
jgi:hypothetical protein